MTNKNYEGFEYFDTDTQEKRRIYYIEEKGKDSLERWRLELYYQPNFACTCFCNSPEAYEEFLKKNKPCCFPDYTEFRAWHKEKHCPCCSFYADMMYNVEIAGEAHFVCVSCAKCIKNIKQEGH